MFLVHTSSILHGGGYLFTLAIVRAYPNFFSQFFPWCMKKKNGLKFKIWSWEDFIWIHAYLVSFSYLPWTKVMHVLFVFALWTIGSVPTTNNRHFFAKIFIYLFIYLLILTNKIQQFSNLIFHNFNKYQWFSFSFSFSQLTLLQILHQTWVIGTIYSSYFNFFLKIIFFW